MSVKPPFAGYSKAAIAGVPTSALMMMTAARRDARKDIGLNEAEMRDVLQIMEEQPVDAVEARTLLLYAMFGDHETARRILVNNEDLMNSTCLLVTFARSMVYAASGDYMHAMLGMSSIEARLAKYLPKDQRRHAAFFRGLHMSNNVVFVIAKRLALLYLGRIPKHQYQSEWIVLRGGLLTRPNSSV